MRVKIGIFLCDCGGSLKNIDFSKISQKLEGLEDVAFVDTGSNLCLEEGKKAIASRILTEDIDRIVIAACSPQLHEGNFVELLNKLRLNPNLLSLANIREQCAWTQKGDATAKALEMIMMAVNRARLLEPVETTEVAVKKEALVVGGGYCGMQSALELSQLGIKTTLVEKSASLGGSMNGLDGAHNCAADAMSKAVKDDKNIAVITSAEVSGVKGSVGNFTATIKKAKDETRQDFGAIVVATGYQTEMDTADFPVKPGAKVIPQGKLAEMLKASIPEMGARPETIGFVFDLADESARRPSLATLNNALTVKERWGSEVYVFCRNVQVDSEGAEKLYREARDKGVVFLKFDDKPAITANNGRVKIEVKDALLGEELTLDCDLLVAEETLMPTDGTAALSESLGVKTDSKGFYQEENVHLYPVDSERKGIFLVGKCRGDLDHSRVQTDISSVVAKLSELLSPGEIAVEADRVKVDPQKCVACLTCIRVCPHKAIGLTGVDGEKETAEISQLACDRCGICAAVCPVKAIKFEGYSDEQILAQIEAIGAS